MKRFEVFEGDLLISCSGTMGKVAIVPSNHRKGIINQALLKLTPDKNRVIGNFLKLVLESGFIQDKYFKDQSGSSVQNVASVTTLKAMKIPLPPIEIQKQLVAEAEREGEIVAANRQLIELMEEKIQAVLGEI